MLTQKARRLFEAYNEAGPNPWKTHDGREVPGWDELTGPAGEQVKAKWLAVAAASDDEVRLVRAFQLHIKQSVSDVPSHLTLDKARERERHMVEETKEFVQAAMEDDLAGMADALVDLDYIVKGTANIMGLTRAWPHLFADVHRANMAKVPGPRVRDGVLHRFDAVKPPGWRGPETLPILRFHGYDPSAKRVHTDSEGER